MTTLDYLLSISTSVIASAIVAFILYVIQLIRYYVILINEFDNRIFDVYWKEHTDKIIYSVKCTVKKNIIKYEVIDPTSSHNFSGEFIIDPINLKTGNGYQLHRNYDGFNFPKIVIKDNNTFLVQSTYIKMIVGGNEYGEIYYHAFTWKKR